MNVIASRARGYGNALAMRAYILREYFNERSFTDEEKLSLFCMTDDKFFEWCNEQGVKIARPKDFENAPRKGAERSPLNYVFAKYFGEL